MKISDLDVEEFIKIMQQTFNLNEYLTCKQAISQYNITANHLQYHIRSKHIKTAKIHGLCYILRSDMDRLLQCKMLKIKDKK